MEELLLKGYRIDISKVTGFPYMCNQNISIHYILNIKDFIGNSIVTLDMNSNQANILCKSIMQYKDIIYEDSEVYCISGIMNQLDILSHSCYNSYSIILSFAEPMNEFDMNIEGELNLRIVCSNRLYNTLYQVFSINLTTEELDLLVYAICKQFYN